jgi:large subunit ribosomal protein L31e
MVKKTKQLTPAAREYTIHLHKRLHGIGNKKRAPRAIREIKKYAVKEMHTEDVRVDPGLNKFLWSKGVRYVPYRVRVRFSRRVSNEDGEESMYTLITHVPVASFKSLKTKVIDEQADEDLD